MQKKWIACLALIVLVLVVAAFFMSPLSTYALYDGYADFTITIHGASAAEIAGIRYVEVAQPSYLEWLPSLPDKELLDMSEAPFTSTATSITVIAWFGGKKSSFGTTYLQTYGILLLLPGQNDELTRRVVVLPDHRKSKSFAVDLREGVP